MFTLNKLLSELSQGKRVVTVELPNKITFQGIVTDINLSNPEWKPIKIVIITKGLQIEDKREVTLDFIGDTWETYQRPYVEDWIYIGYIKSIDFEENKQIDLPL